MVNNTCTNHNTGTLTWKIGTPNMAYIWYHYMVYNRCTDHNTGTLTGKIDTPIMALYRVSLHCVQ